MSGKEQPKKKQEQPKQKKQEQPKGQEQPKKKQEQPKGQEQPKKKQEQPKGQEQPKKKQEQPKQQNQEQPKKKQEQPKKQNQEQKKQEQPKGQEQPKKKQEQPKKNQEQSKKQKGEEEVEIVTPGATNFSFNFDSTSFAGTVLGTDPAPDFWNGKLNKNVDDEAEEDPIESFPLPQQRRIYALKDLHAKYSTLSDQFRAELKLLEEKYEKLYEPIYEQRKKIVLGEIEPEESQIPEDQREKFKGLTAQQIQKEKGLPGFWLTVLKNARAFSEMITARDEEALNFLTDIRFKAGKDEDFALEFVFGENPFFSNEVLSKNFECKVEKGELDITNVSGTSINWKSQKQNLTVKLVKKSVGGKKRGGRGGKGGPQTKMVEEEAESFFTYFASPPGIESEADEMLKYFYHQEYDLASLVKDSLIPEAVLWFLGEKDDDDDEDEYDEDGMEDDMEEDEFDEEEEDEEEEEASFRGRGRGGRGGRGGRRGGRSLDINTKQQFSGGQTSTVDQAECKNQ